MHTLWSAMRSVFAVVAGIVVLVVVSFGVELPLKWFILRTFPAAFPEAAVLDTNLWWMLSQWLYSTPALILGGYTAAWLAPRRGFAHAVAMAVVQELLTVLLMFNPPHPVPAWMWATMLVVTPVAIIFGGYLWSRRTQPK